MKNKIVIEQRDDSLRQRHSNRIQHVRTFVALVNGIEVDTWTDDLPPTYASGKYLDQEIYSWVQRWEKALNCTAVFIEKPDRIIHPKLPGMI